MMLSLLLYPLRKRIRWMEYLGSMPSWFNYHMVIGIGGPLLIVFHSTFHTSSMNGAVALYATLVVAISGVIGRFVYRHVHQGLDGQLQTLESVDETLKKSAEEIRAEFAKYPDVISDLESYRHVAFEAPSSQWQAVVQFITLRHRGEKLAEQLSLRLKKTIRAALASKEIRRTEGKESYLRSKRMILAYVDAVCNASQLSVWERLFSMWHYLHIPFIYLLVLSGVIHVVAVHIY